METSGPEAVAAQSVVDRLEIRFLGIGDDHDLEVVRVDRLALEMVQHPAQLRRPTQGRDYEAYLHSGAPSTVETPTGSAGRWQARPHAAPLAPVHGWTGHGSPRARTEQGVSDRGVPRSSRFRGRPRASAAAPAAGRGGAARPRPDLPPRG